MKIIKRLFLFILLLFASCSLKDNKQQRTELLIERGSLIEIDTILGQQKTFQCDSVKVGKQVWMKRNLDVVTFRNGDSIFNAKTDEEWLQAAKDKKPAWCYYNNDKELGKKYGVLYNLYALLDERQLAPQGWRLPTVEDWKSLIKYPAINSVRICVDGSYTAVESIEKAEMKFLAGGKRHKGVQYLSFEYLGQYAEHWVYLEPEDRRDGVFFISPPGSLRTYDSDERFSNLGASVRCIKENKEISHD